MTSLPRRMWNGRLWAYSANTSGYPQFDGDEVTLTANSNNRSGVLFLMEDRVPPFTVELEYLTWDNDGCTAAQNFNCVYRTADGWVFMFGKDIVPYEEAPPPTAQSRGFVPDGTGLGVHFRLYEVRGVGLRDGALNLVSGIGEETYSESYRRVRIVVDPDRIRVYLDGSSSPRINYVPDAPWDTSYRWIGIGAGTGGAAAMHKIRNVVVTP
jgi:hypothetical protein